MDRATKIRLERYLILNRMFTTPEGKYWRHNTFYPEVWEAYNWIRRN